jgi:hypothetical protein
MRWAPDRQGEVFGERGDCRARATLCRRCKERGENPGASQIARPGYTMSYISDGMYARIGDLRRARRISRGGHQLRSPCYSTSGVVPKEAAVRALIEDHGFRKGEAGTGKAVEWGGAGCRRSGDLMRWGGLCEVDSSLSGTFGSKELHIITVPSPCAW